MKSRWLFASLCVHAAICVAQTSPMLLAAGADRPQPEAECEVDNPELENKLLSEWNDGNGTLPHYPKRSDWSRQVASNGPSLAAGGGIDVVITRPFPWRLIHIQCTHSWMGGVDNIHPDSGFRIATEAVLRRTW